MIVIDECTAEGSDFEAVLALSKLAKATVGFLPDAAFRERAERGTLLVARIDGRLSGYVLYDLPRSEVRIRQVVVATDVRHSGIARALVNELASRHASRAEMLLECRRDFPVNALWPRLGFAPVVERKGRSVAGLPLTIWRRDLGGRTLFSAVPEDQKRPIASLDVGIVIDLAEGAESTSDALNAEWIRNVVQLGVTDHVFVELDKHDDPAVRARHKAQASSALHIHVDHAVADEVLGELQNRTVNADRFKNDLRHVAMAVGGGSRWFVTRDQRFQAACAQTIESVTDLSVVSPGELLMDLDRLVRGDTYRPIDLRGSSLSVRAVEAGELNELADLFVNQREHESKFHLRGALERCIAETPSSQLRVIVDGSTPVALLGTRLGVVEQLVVCRVGRSISAQTTLARQVTALAREAATERDAKAVRLTDAHCGEKIRSAAVDEGFMPAEAGFTAVPVLGAGTRDALLSQLLAVEQHVPAAGWSARFRQIACDPNATLLAEHVFHPWRITDASIPTFVVPIEPTWAEALFDENLARNTLFPRDRELTIQREHVYYRAPGASGGMDAPARIVWYVKKGPANDRGLRAVSSLRDVTVGDPARMYRRFQHLGVFDEGQVRAAARNNRVMALRFADTTLFRSPVPLDRYRALMAEQGTGLLLQSPQRLPERVFESLLR